MAKPVNDPFSLIEKYLPDWTPSVIFDVGANVGQSAEVYAQRFPDATIHCFEPSPGSHEELVAAMQQYPKVTTHRLALGRSEATLSLTQTGRPTMFRLLPAEAAEDDQTVKVVVRPGIDVMRDLNIERIDFLKIDTEGHDLDVLMGFLPAIDRIDFVQVEAGMNPYNTTHAPFAKLDDLLKNTGFSLFYIFEQRMEWKRGGRPVLRRSNPLYINARLVDTRGIR
jgi:FkbM family methyltransferase